MFRTWPVRFDAIRFTLSVKILPRSRNAFDLRLTAEFSFGSHFAGHAGHFRRERAELRDHRVDGFTGSQKFALERPVVDLEIEILRQIALGDGADHAGDLGRRLGKIGDQRVDRIDARRPAAGRVSRASRAAAILPSLPTTSLMRPSSDVSISFFSIISLMAS